jgi:hypothetical protein
MDMQKYKKKTYKLAAGLQMRQIDAPFKIVKQNQIGGRIWTSQA